MKKRVWLIGVAALILIAGCGAREEVSVEEKYKEAVAAFPFFDQSGSLEAAKPLDPAFPYWSISALDEIELIEEKERFNGLFYHPPSLIHEPGALASVILSKIPEQTVIQLELEAYDREMNMYTKIDEKRTAERKQVFLRLPHEENIVYRMTMHV